MTFTDNTVFFLNSCKERRHIHAKSADTKSADTIHAKSADTFMQRAQTRDMLICRDIRQVCGSKNVVVQIEPNLTSSTFHVFYQHLKTAQTPTAVDAPTTIETPVTT